MTTHANPIVADYLRQLERASASLPRARRSELLAEIREHIDDALLEAGSADEVAVRNVLERLGSPDEIVAAAGPASGPTRRAGVLEIVALVALAVPVVGTFVGIPLLIVSAAWSRQRQGDRSDRERDARAHHRFSLCRARGVGNVRRND